MSSSGDLSATDIDRIWPEGTPFVVGVAGGSGSGKSTICRSIVDQVGTEKVSLMSHDAYYHHRPDLSYQERTRVNYDHPDSLETELLLAHLEDLREGKPVEQPIYDFTRHLRRAETVPIPSGPVILIEGILLLVEPELREMLDLKVFVDTDADLRVIRRMERDMAERGRSFDSIVAQYHATVRPMHRRFVEPSKRHADMIIPRGFNHRAVGTLVALIREVLEGHPV
ncbi:MAG: uridine kinase [bacterium]|nr:uridine kinase [bacterium]MCY3652852.1 uridine kinase [bacterium]